MRDVKVIKKEISTVEKEISKLETLKKKLEKELIAKSDTFEAKFKAWMESGLGEHSRWLPSENEYPHLRAYIEKRDLDRHRKYNLFDMFDEEIAILLEGKEEDEYFTKIASSCNIY